MESYYTQGCILCPVFSFRNTRSYYTQEDTVFVLSGLAFKNLMVILVKSNFILFAVSRKLYYSSTVAEGSVSIGNTPHLGRGLGLIPGA